MKIDPIFVESTSDRLCFAIFKGDDLRPPQKAIYYRQAVLIALGWDRETNQVEMNVLEPAVRGDKRSWVVLDVPSDLGCLAVESGLAPELEVSVHSQPDVLLADDLFSRTRATVCEGVKHVEHAPTQWFWDIQS